MKKAKLDRFEQKIEDALERGEYHSVRDKFKNQSFVDVEVDIPKDLLESLKKQAKKENKTLNDYVIGLLKSAPRKSNKSK